MKGLVPAVVPDAGGERPGMTPQSDALELNGYDFVSAKREEATACDNSNARLFSSPAVAGGFTVTVLALPGLVTEGDTIEQAREMVKGAIRGYLESLIAHGGHTERRFLNLSLS